MQTNSTDPHKIALALQKQLELFESHSQDKSVSAEAAFSLLIEYDNAVGNYFRIKAKDSNSNSFRNFQETIISTTHELLKYRPNENKTTGYQEWLKEYRSLWRKNIELFYFCVCLFVISIIIGLSIGMSDPSLVPVIVPQHLMEMILDHTKWFEELQKDPILGGLGIAFNNVRVAITAFLLGAILGIGGLIILCFNGLLFGAVFGYCMVNGFHEQLLDFVASHGFLELTIIVASTFAGLVLGRIFYHRPYTDFTRRFRQAAHDAGIIATGVVPWLLLAAFFEGFVSPFHYLPTSIKLGLGFTIGILFFIWTFKGSSGKLSLK